jgi:hypothetical protein
VDEAYLLVWEGPDLLEGSETNEIAHGAPAQIYPSAGNRGLRHQEQPSQFHSTLAPLPLHPILRRSDGTPTGKIAILGWETETKDFARRQLVRSPSYMSVRAQGLISNAHYRPCLWDCIRHAASCSLPLSKRREQLKRTTGEPQHDISRDACGLSRAA